MDLFPVVGSNDGKETMCVSTFWLPFEQKLRQQQQISYADDDSYRIIYITRVLCLLHLMQVRYSLGW